MEIKKKKKKKKNPLSGSQSLDTRVKTSGRESLLGRAIPIKITQVEMLASQGPESKQVS